MKHNLKKIIYLLILTLGISSCRQQEEAITESKNDQKTFRLFNKKNYNNILNSKNNSFLSKYYAFDFLQAFYSYDLRNDTNYTGINIKGPVPTSYVNFRLHSQVIEDKEGNIYMYFPLIKSEKVIDIYFSVINKENTSLGLYKLKNTDEEYNEIFLAFEKFFNNPNEKIFSRSEDTTDVGEVIIKGPSKPTYGVGVVGPGQCEMYNQCSNGGSGSSGGSGGGGGGGGITPPPPPPTIPIEDIKIFMSCLNTNQSANLTVYAAEMFSSSKSGHAFISITQGTNTLTFGFYPKTGLAGSITGPGVFGNDGGHAYSTAWNIGTISPTQLQNIIATAIAYSNSNYDLGFNNCVDFTIGTLNNAGVNFTSIGVDTPTSFSNTIKSSATSTNGNAPQTKGCK